MNNEEKMVRLTSDADRKIAYHKPELKMYGDVRTLTIAVTADGAPVSNFESSRRRGEDTDSSGDRGGRRGE